jgi:hypothetical protein
MSSSRYEVKIGNGTGANAVNIQDGGNTITVDATDLDIRDLVFATDKVDVSGSTVSVISEEEGGLLVQLGTTVTTQPTGSVEISSSITGNGQTVTTGALFAKGGVWVDVSGTWSGIIIFEGSVDGSIWNAISMAQASDGSFELGVNSSTFNNLFQRNVAGLQFMRVRSTSWTSGTANIAWYSSSGSVGAFPVQIGTLGAAASAASVPVVVASDSTVTVAVGSSVLPTGAATLAEQQTQTASLSVLDDWDESDRAKVNPIVGQAGVQGGAGTVTALTQRIAIATDANAISGTVSTLPADLYTTRLDEATATITYVGVAAPGTATSAASWRIKRLDSTSGLIVLYADANTNFDNIWDNRAALSYTT